MPKKHFKITFSLLLIATAIFSCQKDAVNNTSSPKPTYYSINSPQDLVVDNTGNVYVTNKGDNNILVINSFGVISFYAGTDTVPGCTGNGGLAVAAHLWSPEGIAIDKAGNIYYGDYVCAAVHKITAGTGIITLIAGNGGYTYSGDGGPAISAAMNRGEYIALDTSANIYIADLYNYRVRKVNAGTGIITTVAGNGTTGSAGDGGQATAAQIAPASIAVDDSGNIYVADAATNKIRKIYAATGIVVSIAGNGSQGFIGDGIQATASGMAPGLIIVDTAKNMYLADYINARVRRINMKTGIITTVAGNGNKTAANNGDGGQATAATLPSPSGVALDNAGNLYITDSYANNIRKVNLSTGIISTLAHN